MSKTCAFSNMQMYHEGMCINLNNDTACGNVKRHNMNIISVSSTADEGGEWDQDISLRSTALLCQC